MANYRKTWFDNNESNRGWYTCIRCGKKLRKGDIDIDHIIPQKHGGGDYLNNLQCMCKTCNRSKQADIDFDTAKDLLRNTVDNTSKTVKSGLESFFNKHK